MTTHTKPAKDWRFRAPGGASSLGFFLKFFPKFFLSVLIFFQVQVFAADENAASKYDSFEKKTSRFIDESPYIPKKREYSLDLGTLWEEQTYLWLGGHVGFHLGGCYLLEEKDCQFYVDAMTGIGVHNNDSASWAMGGLRWQFINYPSPWSYSVRLMAGLAHSSVQSVIRNEFMYGAGFSVTRYLHERLDARVEFRIGRTHRLFTQINFGFQVKVDEWVGYFAKKLKDLGEGTLKATGNILKATGKAVISPFQSKDKPDKKILE